MSVALWPVVAGDRFHLDARLYGFQSSPQLAAEREGAVEAAKAAVCFDVTNVARFFYETSEQDYWDWLVDFPCIAPPFDTFWMEFQAPRVIRTDKGALPWDQGFEALGAIFFGDRLSDAPVDLNYISHQFGDGATDTVVSLLHAMADQFPNHWILRIEGFIRQNGRVFKTPERITFLLDDTGKPVTPPHIQVLYLAPDGEVPVISQAAGMYFPFALALSFLHCKNILVEDTRDPRSRQVRRADERTGLPTPHYKTLVIEPMKRVLETEGGIRQNGLKKALHICRGHFAHYSEDKPLFGKYSGQFWIPAHVRGTTESGQVVKDYKVNSPKAVA